MEILNQDDSTFHLTRHSEIQGWSSSLSSIRENQEFFQENCKLMAAEHLCREDRIDEDTSWHQNEINISRWRRQNFLCGSTPGAPSLVPTSSEVCIGPNTRDGGQGRRIGILKRRIEVALDGMEVLLRRRPKEPDGEEELERRRTRSIEFLSRFSRNYLFQLRMQVMELRRQMQYSSFASPGRYTQHQLLLKKLVAAHQTAVQGIQACLNQLRGSVPDSAILSKLDQLLNYLCELTSLRSQVDVNASLIGSEDPHVQDSILVKAKNLIEIVQKKKKEREEADDAWRVAAAVLAKKHFGLPSTAKTKTVSKPLTQQERKSSRKADRRGKKQGVGKKLRSFKTKTDFQGGEKEPSSPTLSHFEPKQRVEGQDDAPLDPATALELRIIMSRMKDILRRAHVKPSTPPMYPPNVKLVCITHEEGLCDVQEPIEEGEDAYKKDDPTDKDELENRIQDPAHNFDETLPTKPSSQEILPSKVSSDSAKESETSSSVSNTFLQRRRLALEEQRKIQYRNRFRSHKERVREIQQTSEQILSTVFREVASELEPSILLEKMYQLELQG